MITLMPITIYRAYPPQTLTIVMCTKFFIKITQWIVYQTFRKCNFFFVTESLRKFTCCAEKVGVVLFKFYPLWMRTCKFFRVLLIGKITFFLMYPSQAVSQIRISVLPYSTSKALQKRQYYVCPLSAIICRESKLFIHWAALLCDNCFPIK